MSWLYRTLIRPSLFAQDSEDIHNFTVKALGRISRAKLVCEALASCLQPDDLPVSLWNLRFPNPIGLAAGMDKEAEAVPAWHALGFGFSELGGVTCQAQPGNPRPRIFRAIPDEALVNRMGFNNPGAEAIAARLSLWRNSGRWPEHPVGINLGKSKITPLDQAAADYARSFRLLWEHADFFVVNVSSPNTPNLRQLQDKAALDEILRELQSINQELARTGLSSVDQAHPEMKPSPGRPLPAEGWRPLKPILVKVAPDLSFEALDDIVALVEPRQLAGLVATNTTITRPAAPDPALTKVYSETGGLSGRPLRARSTEVIRHLFRATRGALPIIGSGGVFNAQDAWEKIRAGATLIQIYTGLVYEGPTAVKAIVKGLRRKLAETGLVNLQQAVGLDVSQ